MRISWLCAVEFGVTWYLGKMCKRCEALDKFVAYQILYVSFYLLALHVGCDSSEVRLTNGDLKKMPIYNIAG